MPQAGSRIVYIERRGNQDGGKCRKSRRPQTKRPPCGGLSLFSLGYLECGFPPIVYPATPRGVIFSAPAQSVKSKSRFPVTELGRGCSQATRAGDSNHIRQVQTR